MKQFFVIFICTLLFTLCIVSLIDIRENKRYVYYVSYGFMKKDNGNGFGSMELHLKNKFPTLDSMKEIQDFIAARNNFQGVVVFSVMYLGRVQKESKR